MRGVVIGEAGDWRISYAAYKPAAPTASGVYHTGKSLRRLRPGLRVEFRLHRDPESGRHLAVDIRHAIDPKQAKAA